MMRVFKDKGLDIIRCTGPYGEKYRIYVHFFLFGDVLIDTGCSAIRNDFLSYLKDKRLSLVLLTHWHEDHTGNAKVFENTGVPVYGHPITKDILLNWDNRKINLYRRKVWGLVEKTRILEFPNRVIHYGDFIFEVYHTPGHSEDHCIILEKNNGYLFSGDLYIDAHVKNFRLEENIKEYYESLKLARDLDANIMFCASGRILEDPKKALSNKIGFLEDMFYKVERLYYKGYPPWKIRDELFGRESSLSRFTSFHFSYLNFIKIIIRDILNRKANSSY